MARGDGPPHERSGPERRVRRPLVPERQAERMRARAQAGARRERADASAARAVEVALQNAGRYRDVATPALRRWLEDLVAAIAPEATSFGVRLCGDRAMRASNSGFRGRDQVTDVLSFPGEASPEPGHLGDVLVCVPQARRQAAARGQSLERELKTLLLHGVLHCRGYDHETDGGEMERLERRLRRRWLSDD